ncbi:7-deoxyloganetic acid glucosyltransferase-like isoform X2 [Malania oleifera]|uniref:7-deoxyloganetic acid glucosyltransferase-like isoform X2 n=1 Tax=Malania oleifera TaxID=397392 RepID=UPI0025AE902C|nr:7-deoxyloganetic acid glucosyltransferase-like isoform X2 [Malania oleifera]
MDRQPHVLVFPCPIQGNVNSMLKLAELLSFAGLTITFLNSDYCHRRLLCHTDILTRFSRFPGFRFETCSDGLPADHPRSGDRMMDVFYSLEANGGPILKELLISGRLSSDGRRPVTCIIADGVLACAVDVAKDLGISLIFYRAISACFFWAAFCIPQLIEAGELPFTGMESFLRRRDLPNICRTSDPSYPVLQFFMTGTRRNSEAHALIINTFEELEGPIVSHIRTHCPTLYTIGPIHAHLKSRLAAETKAASSSPLSSKPKSNSLWEEDRSCVAWLDAQPPKSVIYVSFGSITVMTRDELMEIWHGLVKSEKAFLWVIRSDGVVGKDGTSESGLPTEVLEGTKGRGCIVGWAPQEEVLAHRAVGGFLTHSGWNSTLESVVAGVPMLCWPRYMDQQVNSRFVSEVWKIGIDMKDTCDRVIVEKLVRDLMEGRRPEFDRSTDEMAQLARGSVAEGGSSYSNLDRLIEVIKSTGV